MMILLLSACSRDTSSGWGDGTGSVNTDFSDNSGAGSGAGGGSTGSDTGGESTDTADTGSGDSGTDTPGGDPPEEGTGYGVGDTAHNLQGTSHTGAPWSLYDQLGSPVVLLVGHLDLGSSMSGPMGFLAEASGGAIDAAIIGRNAISTASSVEDAAAAASEYGVSTVLFDPSFVTVDQWSDGAAPKAYVIDEDLIIRWVGFGGSITASAIQGTLDDL